MSTYKLVRFYYKLRINFFAPLLPIYFNFNSNNNKKPFSKAYGQ